MLQKIKPIYIKIGLLIILLISIYLAILGRQFKPTNPYKDSLNEDSEAGKSYCIVYNGGTFYELTRNDTIFSDLKYDLRSYVNSFYGNKVSSDLCGFTFRVGYKKSSDSIYEFSGKYYGVEDDIKIVANKLKNNSLRVSITNKAGQKIDDKLRLNGPVANLIDKLPIDESLYSIRYLQQDTTIIVTFYRGFTTETVVTVESKLRQILNTDPTQYPGKIRYFVNTLGEFNLDYIKKNIVSLSKQ